MPDFLLLMHTDIASGAPPTLPGWAAYLAHLQATGAFQGGSAIGPGACIRKAGTSPPVTAHLSGFIRIGARDLQHAETLLVGNPVLGAGGTVEIRALPET